MKNPLSFVHIHSNRANSKASLFMLFIPSLVFFFVLTFLTFQYRSQRLTTVSDDPATLGTEVAVPDNPK